MNKLNDFADFVCQHIGGERNPKKSGDYGVDGWMPDRTPLQVKRSQDIGRDVLDKFVTAARRNDLKLFEERMAAGKSVGTIIAFSFGKGIVEEAARLRNKEGIIVSLVQADEVVSIARKPDISLEYEVLTTGHAPHRIAFSAAAKCEKGHAIVNYAYDFNYDKDKGFDAAEFISKDGKAEVELAAGSHVIAVKAVDDEGLENMEIMTLVVNGGVRAGANYTFL
jgi:hypothetical protein